jgi:Tfp pilus assembly protein PilV
MRGGLSLIELMVAALVASLVFYGAYEAIRGLARGSHASEKEAAAALVRSQLTEQWMQDLRSAVRVSTATPGQEYYVHRHVASGSPGAWVLALRVVHWEVSGRRVIRSVTGERDSVYDFGPVGPPLRLSPGYARP